MMSKIQIIEIKPEVIRIPAQPAKLFLATKPKVRVVEVVPEIIRIPKTLPTPVSSMPKLKVIEVRPEILVIPKPGASS